MNKKKARSLRQKREKIIAQNAAHLNKADAQLAAANALKFIPLTPGQKAEIGERDTKFDCVVCDFSLLDDEISGQKFDGFYLNFDLYLFHSEHFTVSGDPSKLADGARDKMYLLRMKLAAKYHPELF